MADPVETPIGTVTVAHFHPGPVRHQTFVGPKCIYALFNPRGRMHAVFRAFMDFIRDGDLPFRRLLLNEHVVDEAATRREKPASMRNAARFLQAVDESTLYRIERVTAEVIEAASATFVDRDDVDASFTDIATHLDDLEVDHLVTYDRHFDAFDITTLPYTAR